MLLLPEVSGPVAPYPVTAVGYGAPREDTAAHPLGDRPHPFIQRGDSRPSWIWAPSRPRSARSTTLSTGPQRRGMLATDRAALLLAHLNHAPKLVLCWKGSALPCRHFPTPVGQWNEARPRASEGQSGQPTGRTVLRGNKRSGENPGGRPEGSGAGLAVGSGPATMKCPGGAEDRGLCAAEQLPMVLRVQGSRMAHLG